MFKKVFLLFGGLFLVLLVGCNPAAAPTVMPTAKPAATATPLPEPQEMTPTPSGEEPVLMTVQAEVARQLGVDMDSIESLELRPVEWSDACLDYSPAADTICAQVITPGFQGEALVNGQRYEVRSNADGSLVILAPGAALSARETLEAEFGFGPDEVQFVSLEEVEWPDACLGAPDKGEMCAQMITSGYLIRLEAGGRVYELHTNPTGSLVRIASATPIENE